MTDSDYKSISVRNVEETRSISKNLIEKSLQMRCLSYISDIKAKLLTETIFEVDASRKLVQSSKESVEKQFLQAQKMEAVGTLVAGIAHDFNNMLSAISGNVFLAKRSEPLDLEGRLDAIEEVVVRAAEMIQQLLAYSRKEHVSMQPVDLAPFIKESAKLMKASIPESVCLSVDISNEPMIVNGSVSQIQQIILNLLVNAMDAVKMRGNPSISVKLEKQIPDGALNTRFPSIQPEALAHLLVSDNGTGIADGLVDKIFDPFFTTKEIGEGTGLGLAMVYGAVESHGGIIDVITKQNIGTEFHIYFPLIEAPQVTKVQTPTEVIDGNGELILVVDDDSMVLNITRELLLSLNYNVICARDGLEAIEIYRKSNGDISLIFMDVVMPNMGGIQAARAIRIESENVPIIFCTGYGDKENTHNALEFDHAAYLTKPYRAGDISSVIRELI